VKLKASNGEAIVNAAVTDALSGKAVLDPSNITNSSKEQSITKVEYYTGDTLVQTVEAIPYALDTTKLANGLYTITERTYFNDGSHSEVTKVVSVANAQSAVGGGGSFWITLGQWVMGLVTVGGAAAAFVVWRRRQAATRFGVAAGPVVIVDSPVELHPAQPMDFPNYVPYSDNQKADPYGPPPGAFVETPPSPPARKR
jgi:hypothetical protein